MQASSANGPPEIQAGKPQPRPLSTRSVEAATRALLAFHEANEEQGATIVELRLVKDLRRSSEGSGFGRLAPADLTALVSYLLERRYGWSEIMEQMPRRFSTSPKAAEKSAGRGEGQTGAARSGTTGSVGESTAVEGSSSSLSSPPPVVDNAGRAPSAQALRRCKAELNATLDVLVSKRLCRKTTISLPLLGAFTACARKTSKAVVRQQTCVMSFQC